MNQIDFMQQVALKASELQSEFARGATREWKLGFKMLHNPKLHCPFCEEWIESKRVWIVDEAGYRVKRVWKLDGTKINVDGCHPHVGSGGAICMGSARTATDALVAGIAGRDDFIRAWDWFPEQLGHTCERMDMARECGRFDRYADDPFEDDHDGESYCEDCDSWYDENEVYFCDRNDSYYCEGCWADSHDSCEDCGCEIHTHGDETSYEVEGRYGVKYVCEECYQGDYFTCEYCDRGLKNDKYQEDGICVDCWAENHFTCTECNEDRENEDSSNIAGVCTGCAYQCVTCLDWFIMADLSKVDNGYCGGCWDNREEASDGE